MTAFFSEFILKGKCGGRNLPFFQRCPSLLGLFAAGAISLLWRKWRHSVRNKPDGLFLTAKRSFAAIMCRSVTICF